MQESDYPNLRAAKEIDAFHYHAAGMVEAQDRIRHFLATLDGVYGKDCRKTASVLTSLWVEIYEHLKYHMKELKIPLSDLMEKAYKEFEDSDPERFKEWSTTLDMDDEIDVA